MIEYCVMAKRRNHDTPKFCGRYADERAARRELRQIIQAGGRASYILQRNAHKPGQTRRL